jgi:hypothetical protein
MKLRLEVSPAATDKIHRKTARSEIVRDRDRVPSDPAGIESSGKDCYR